ncbi:molybdate ABC transporter substrate-binding protein [Sphingomonas sp.]|jgi:molybdate transport system substrate-binding protein|uniref:molybdate ABC transporter substrate-binding protein n=1 Tax=Sphingomonas sp. TaxID=28214 RepID=UPI002618DBA1|nr:molybdate ABC transporter substrate-binding protein [Sphingomonas sp.]MDF2495174.1 molybdenum transporter substrate-binding protein [Sphingomonas sp.]
MRLWSLLLMLLTLLGAPAAAQGRGPLVLAAASMQEALGEAADSWARQGHERPVLSFAASSALARQIGAGAPADLFISADERWMNWLAERRRIVPSTRAVLAGNQLVVVAARGRGQELGGRGGLALGQMLAAGPLAMGDPMAVPAGRYGKAALERLGAWSLVAPRVVRADSVRAALSLVERGAAPYGVVYATDARIAPRLRIVGRFPAASHPAITYPIARLSSARHPGAEGFRQFLLSPAGKAIMARHGFAPR